MSPEDLKVNVLNQICRDAYESAKKRGFWDKERNDGESIALMHSELSEALEALREGNDGDVVEELADVLIRIFDYCGGRGHKLGQAVVAKMKFNETRPHMHGKLF